MSLYITKSPSAGLFKSLVWSAVECRMYDFFCHMLRLNKICSIFANSPNRKITCIACAIALQTVYFIILGLHIAFKRNEIKLEALKRIKIIEANICSEWTNSIHYLQCLSSRVAGGARANHRWLWVKGRVYPEQGANLLQC